MGNEGSIGVGKDCSKGVSRLLLGIVYRLMLYYVSTLTGSEVTDYAFC